MNAGIRAGYHLSPASRPGAVLRGDRRRRRSIATICRPPYAVSIGASLCMVETDASQLPASAREREAPLLHRIKGDIGS